MQLMNATALRKRYGAREVVRGVSLSIDEGEVVALLGPNGAGKTTAIELILGVRRADAGSVSWWSPSPRAQIGVQLQTAPTFPGLSALENVRVVSSFYGKALSHKQAQELLDRCGLGAVARLDAASLSGGQRKRLSIAMALAHQPKLIFLDEPTAALDPRAQVELRALLRRLSQEGVSILLCSHDMHEVEQLAHRLVLIESGEVRAQGTPAALLAQHRVSSMEELYLALTTAPHA